MNVRFNIKVFNFVFVMSHTITLLRIHLQENMLQVKLISAPVMMFDNVHI